MVVDASVVVEALTNRGAVGTVAREVLDGRALRQSAAIVRAEVVSALRSMARQGVVASDRARAAAARATALQLELHAFEPYLPRVWELRDNLSVYDAWYVAVAEALGTPLVTADARLAQAPGVRCPIEVLSS